MEMRFVWDAEAAVWIATSEDVPGLVLEDEDIDALAERAKRAAEELGRMNGAEMNKNQ